MRGRAALRGRAAPVDLVYRRAVLSELVEREDDVRAFLEAYRDGLALFVNSFRCRLSEDKAFFAILTDEAFADLLSEDERALRRARRALDPPGRGAAHPEGRARRSTSCRSCVENRERLVLKPAHGYGGPLGLRRRRDRPRRVGGRRAGRASGAPWVVQERVAIPEEPFPVFEGGALALRAPQGQREPVLRGRAPRWAP